MRTGLSPKLLVQPTATSGVGTEGLFWLPGLRAFSGRGGFRWGGPKYKEMIYLKLSLLPLRIDDEQVVLGRWFKLILIDEPKNIWKAGLPRWSGR